MPYQEDIFDSERNLVAQVAILDHRYYILEDGLKEIISEVPAYCFCCGRYVASEYLVSPRQCAARIRRLKSLQGYEFEVFDFLHGPLPKMIEWSRKTIARWRNRKAPPRCLGCGSTELLQEEIDDCGIPTGQLMHPSYSPRGLTIELVAHVSTATNSRFFNREGEELHLTAQELAKFRFK